MAMCTLDGWVYDWWMSVCLMAMCTLGGWVHAWWMSACLVDELVDECMFGV